ncbi:hypothetical protein C6P42_001515 [Pichia californica]|nr:hypothetical protein C6P42_001515 [[Candida] californica]
MSLAHQQQQQQQQQPPLHPKKPPRATLSQKIKVLDYLAGPPERTQIDTLKYFKNINEFAISQATMSNWVSLEKELREECNNNPHMKSYKKKPVLKYPDIANQLAIHILKLNNDGIQINDKIIRETYKNLMIKNNGNTVNHKLSSGMLKTFKKIIYSLTEVNSTPNINNNNNNNTENKLGTAITSTTATLPSSSVSSSSAASSLITNSQNNNNTLFSMESTPTNLDFNFDDIFNTNTIGFNTRLIHSDDVFSILPNSLPTELTLDNSSSNIIQPNLPQLSPLLSTVVSLDTTILNDKQKNINNEDDHKIKKRTLPFYPQYQNPLNDNTYYKRHKHTIPSLGSKISNPNSEKIEKILENITDGHVTLYNSGTSAIMGILSYINPTTIYIDEKGYKGTHDVIKLLNKLTGVKKFSLFNLTKMQVDDVPINSVIILESPMNPLGYVHDLSYYSNISKSCKSCKLIVDSTLAPPPLQFPFQQGADYVVYSAVKYLAGVSDLGAGFIVSKTIDSKTDLHLERSSLGTSIANFDSFLLVRNLRTYKMRILTQCNNTEKIIKYFKKNFNKYDKILNKIHHASLQQNKDIVMKQLNNYYNPVFALELKSENYPDFLLNEFNFLTNNPNLEGGETLVELIHENPIFNSENDQHNNENLNFNKMLRFSVGCEDYQDIIRDIDQAFTGLINNLQE